MGVVLLVVIRWAATAVIVTFFLMATLAQFGAAEANPGIFDEPTIYIASPLLYLGKTYQETSIPIEVDVYPWGSNNFVDIYYSLDGGSNITLSITTYETSSGIFGKGILSNLTDGYHTVEAYSTDTQGNTISDSKIFLVNTTLVIPFLLSPTNTTYYSKEIPLTYTFHSSKYNIYYQIDTYERYQVEGNTTLPELSEGQHTITIEAYTPSSVIYSKQTARFTIDTTSPTPTPSSEPQSTGQEVILGVALTVAVVVIGLGLLVYLIKRNR
jgi:hypothetical protein